MALLNPTAFSFAEANASAQQLTGAVIRVGVATGGPYTTGTFPITAAELSAGLSSGNFSGTLASIGDSLPAGNYFAVVTATNAVGSSGNSNEFAFQVLGVPAPPTNFSLA